MAQAKQADLLPAYLVIGDDLLKREAVLRRLKVRLEEFGDLAFNSDTFDGETVRGEDIVVACKTLPFASEKRFVLVNSCDKLKKADSQPIVEYLASPNEMTVLCLIADKLNKSSALYKAVQSIGKTSIIDCAKPNKRDLPKQVRGMAKAYGLSLDDSSASYLVDLIGDDTVRIDSELKKISLSHDSTKPVTQADIASLVANVAEAKPWDFVDSFSAKNVKGAMAAFRRMPSISPLVLLGMCVNRIRELMVARTFASQGSSAQASLASALGVPDWRVKNHMQWVRSFTEEELRDALRSALETERQMKSGANVDTAFLEWALSVMSH